MRRLVIHLEIAFGKDEPEEEVHELASQTELEEPDEPFPIGFAPMRKPEEK